MFWGIKEDVIPKLSVSKQKQKNNKISVKYKKCYFHTSLKSSFLKCPLILSMSKLNEDQPPEQFFLNFGVGPKVDGPKFRSIYSSTEDQ